MKLQLHQIADILTGITLRGKPLPAKPVLENVLLMQLGDLDAEGNICKQSMTPVLQQSQYDKFVVKTGDIVFRGRGAGIVAAVMIEAEMPVVAASPLIIVRPNTRKVDPHYLVWALTNDLARRYYAEHSRGSAIVGIGKRDLETLEISLPPLQTQQRIGKLIRLQAQESQLIARYQTARAKLFNAQISESIHKGKAA